MSHLGIQILYDMFNRYDDVWCERVYSPWLDLDKITREKKIPLFALESQEPVKNFDFLGITLQYEMCYTNVLQVLDLSGIPLLAKDRTEEDPIVIGGGPCSYNPEPIAEFFDLFYIGEGETAYRKLLDVYKEVKEKGGSRQEFLLRAARKVPGMYVPSLYEVSYKEDGTIASFLPTKEGVPAKITKEIVMDLDNAPYPEKPVVPFIRVDAGSCRSGNSARLYPRLSFLSGRAAVSSGTRKEPRDTQALRDDDAGQHRSGRNFLELLEFQRLFPSGRAGRLPDDDLSGEKSEYFSAFSAN